jgi:hypothetical protein
LVDVTVIVAFPLKPAFHNTVPVVPVPEIVPAPEGEIVHVYEAALVAVEKYIPEVEP